MGFDDSLVEREGVDRGTVTRRAEVVGDGRPEQFLGGGSLEQVARGAAGEDTWTDLERPERRCQRDRLMMNYRQVVEHSAREKSGARIHRTCIHTHLLQNIRLVPPPPLFVSFLPPFLLLAGGVPVMLLSTACCSPDAVLPDTSRDVTGRFR